MQGPSPNNLTARIAVLEAEREALQARLSDIEGQMSAALATLLFQIELSRHRFQEGDGAQVTHLPLIEKAAREIRTLRRLVSDLTRLLP
jgi:hypothetical protein